MVEIEFLGGWVLDTDPAELEELVRRVEAVADAFGGRHVSAGEFRGGAEVNLDDAAARLDRLAARLAERGLQVAVEAFPWSALAGPTTVPELLRRVTAPNVGQLIDIWHFFNNGGDPDTLTGPIAVVQLNDGPRVHEDFLVHARAARRLPGEGELDVTGLVRAVLRTGFTGPWCVEVNTPEFRALPLDEAAAHRAADTASAALDTAGGHARPGEKRCRSAQSRGQPDLGGPVQGVAACRRLAAAVWLSLSPSSAHGHREGSSGGEFRRAGRDGGQQDRCDPHLVRPRGRTVIGRGRQVGRLVGLDGPSASGGAGRPAAAPAR